MYNMIKYDIKYKSTGVTLILQYFITSSIKFI